MRSSLVRSIAELREAVHAGAEPVVTLAANGDFVGLGRCPAGCEVCEESPGKSDDIESCLFCANFVHVVCGTKSGTGSGVFVCRSCVGS